MFYLKETYTENRVSRDTFLFENHVTEAYHMSAQNLPVKIKEQIVKDIDFIDICLESYVNYMMEKDGWDGKLISYLNDLDKAETPTGKKVYVDCDTIEWIDITSFCNIDCPKHFRQVKRKVVDDILDKDGFCHWRIYKDGLPRKSFQSLRWSTFVDRLTNQLYILRYWTSWITSPRFVM